MFSATAIDPDTVSAFLESEYRVHGERGFTLRVGESSADLLIAHMRENVNCSAFLTSCNPFSKPFEESANAVRQDELAKELSRRSLAFLPGIGQHPSNGWLGEDSFLVFGLTLEDAKAIGKRLEQNGIVWSGADAVPQLVLLR